ncbi:MAG: 4-hydroxythreonine-4-phosphate dehydrogenase PdxA [Candidatus Omnitrophota bacterium]
MLSKRSSTHRDPTTYVTFGDPSGIGPEIVLKALQKPKIHRFGPVVVIGSETLLKRTERLTGLRLPKKVFFVDLRNIKEKRFRFGQISGSFGRAAFEYIQEGVRLIGKEGNGILVTAPISKEALQKAGLSWPGHTEMLRDLTRTRKVNMMFVGRRFRLSLVSRHIAIKALPRYLTRERILDAIFLMHGALRRYFARKNPLLAVASLNPHAGEGGLFGNEEKRLILPAVAAARKKGVRIEGPLPPDTLFYNAYRGAYDGVIAMYHDQGLIPFKMIEREYGVNVTLGLPFIRTSPDHGTAFDIAGKNQANPCAMIEAITLGQAMATASLEY